MDSETKKAEEGATSLIEETDPQLTEEGIKEIRKKGKMYFRSLKAINGFTHYTKGKINDIQIPDAKKNLQYDELKQIVRKTSRIMSDIEKEKTTAHTTQAVL